MKREHWKPFPGCEDYYLVSDQGRVFGLKRGRILRPKVTRSGRLVLTICKDKLKKTMFVHRMVLETFKGPCPPGLEAAHNDGDTQFNWLRNLRWDTHFNNMQDKRKHGTCYEPKGELHHNHKLTEKEVIEIAKSDRPRKDLARHYEVDQKTIWDIRTGRCWGWLTGIPSTRR